MNALFPFRIYSSDKSNGGIYEFRDTFVANKPEYIETVRDKGTRWEWVQREKFIWYTFDVIIHSQTEIEFVAFDMEDFCYGGKGKEIHRFKVKVAKSVTEKEIRRELLSRAALRRELELIAEENRIIKTYANDESIKLGMGLKF